MVLRNNLTTEEHPLGLYHPHAELHHIKKENIGLIEVMGLAILPARLKEELAAVADCLVTGADLRSSELTAKHADWAEGFREKYTFTAENALDIVQQETGYVFAQSACLAVKSLPRRSAPVKRQAATAASSSFKRAGRMARPITSIRPMFSFLMWWSSAWGW